MIKDSVTLDEVIQYLNSLIELDRPAMTALFAVRVPCNEGIAYHPTVQVGWRDYTYLVGMIGILNGLFGVDKKHWGALALYYSTENNELVKIDRAPEEGNRE